MRAVGKVSDFTTCSNFTIKWTWKGIIIVSYTSMGLMTAGMSIYIYKRYNLYCQQHNVGLIEYKRDDDEIKVQEDGGV